MERLLKSMFSALFTLVAETNLATNSTFFTFQPSPPGQKNKKLTQDE